MSLVGAPLGRPLDEGLRGQVEPVLQRLAAAAPADLADPRHQPLSDWSFNNLLLFQQAHDWRVVGGDWPALSGLSYDGQRLLLPLFSLASAPLAALQALLEGHDGFFPLSAAQLDALDATRFDWRESRADADYLYPAAQFVHYRGRLLQKKRNLMKQLLAEHRVQTSPYSLAHQADALAVLQAWLADKHKAAGDADDPPCRLALAQPLALGLSGHMFWADDVPAGFVLAEALSPQVLVVRFAKGVQRFKGIAQYMFHHLARHAAPPVKWLNFEQDLGLANFRQTKLSYQPAALLPKYRVALRQAQAGA